jgi:hypothetical protein
MNERLSIKLRHFVTSFVCLLGSRKTNSQQKVVLIVSHYQLFKQSLALFVQEEAEGNKSFTLMHVGRLLSSKTA